MTSNNISSKDINNKNVLSPSEKNVQNDDLVHKYRFVPARRYIKRERIKEIAEKKYKENGMGITFEDVMAILGVNKNKAQRTLKHLCEENFLFTAQDLEKQGIKLKGFQRKKPQTYYLMEMKAQIIESRKKNVLKDTTGTTTGTTTNFLDIQKIQYLQDWLVKLSDTGLYIHKLQIKTSINKENYDLMDISKIGNAKVHYERIGKVQGHHNVEYRLHRNGTIMIFISCSDNPFRLQDEQDISKIMIFLGKVEDRLKYLLADPKDKVVPSVMEWILRCCDINKDIEIDGKAQLTLPDIQVSLFEKTLRGYVKVIGDKAYYRLEKSLTSNKPIGEALESLRADKDFEKDFQTSG